MSNTNNNPVGILGVRREIIPILESMDILESERTGLARFYMGTLHDKQVVCVEMGVGKINAAAATQSVIDRYHPGCLFFTGSAGGLAPDLDVGDVVIADRVAVHDVGAHRITGFSHIGFMSLAEPGKQSFMRRISASPQLVELTRQVAAKLAWEPGANGRPPNIAVGTVVTGDQVIISAEKKNWLAETFSALVVEMEGAAFAQVADANQVPWALIRSVSDHADHQLDFAFEIWQDYVDDPQTTKARIGRARDRLAYMLHNPQVMWKAKQFLGNITLAARNAAFLTEAVVEAL